MNHICIDGTVFQPKASKTRKGEDIFSFNLGYYNGKDKDKQATYGSIRVTAFRGLAKNAARQLHERDKVKVVGRLRNETWESNGEKHYSTSIIADAIDTRISIFADDSTVTDEDIPFLS